MIFEQFNQLKRRDLISKPMILFSTNVLCFTRIAYNLLKHGSIVSKHFLSRSAVVRVLKREAILQGVWDGLGSHRGFRGISARCG